MGFLQGLIFRYIYMSDLEIKISNYIKKPLIILKSDDDIHILANDTNEIHIQQNTFLKYSVLNFTHELKRKSIKCSF